jgi:hypothetical protein
MWPAGPGNDHRAEIGRPQRPWRGAGKICAIHCAKQQQRQSNAHRKFRHRVADLRLQISGQPRKIAGGDQAEDKQDGFDERRHDSGNRMFQGHAESVEVSQETPIWTAIGSNSPRYFRFPLRLPISDVNKGGVCFES